MIDILLNYMRQKRPRGDSYRYPADIDGGIVSAWKDMKQRGLTYLSNAKIESLLRLVPASENHNRAGVIIEAGCALGGSAIMLCHAKARERPLHVYDVFEMIPPPGENDDRDVHERYQKIASGQSDGISGNLYYGYEEDLYSKVIDSFVECGKPIDEQNVTLHKGLVQDTLVGDDPVALAHIDVDWYDPVMTCLEQIVPRIVPSGCIVLDDYDAWSGCRKATDLYFDHLNAPGFSYDASPGHLVITKAN